MHYFIFLFSLFMSASAMSQTVEQMSFAELQKRMHETKDNLVVLNFWATWCKPCVEELPEFEKLNREYSSKKIKVILVNLDFNSQVKKSVEPFAKNKNLKSEIWHITDSDPNTWINKIDSSWSGAIPATVIYDAELRKIFFKEGQMSYEELEKVILKNRSQDARAKSQD